MCLDALENPPGRGDYILISPFTTSEKVPLRLDLRLIHECREIGEDESNSGISTTKSVLKLPPNGQLPEEIETNIWSSI